MSKARKRVKRSFSDQFERDAGDLVVVEGYTIAAAARAVNVAPGSLRQWHESMLQNPRLVERTPQLESCKPRTSGVASNFAKPNWSERYKKGDGVFCKGVTVKYAWIKSHRDSYALTTLGKVMNVSTSGY